MMEILTQKEVWQWIEKKKTLPNSFGTVIE